MGGGAPPEDLVRLTSTEARSCSPRRHEHAAPSAAFVTEFRSGYGDGFAAVCAACLLDGRSDEPVAFFDRNHWRMDPRDIAYFGQFIHTPWPAALIRPTGSGEILRAWQHALLAQLPTVVGPGRAVADEQLAERMWELLGTVEVDLRSYNVLSRHHAWARWLLNPTASAQDVLMPSERGQQDWRSPMDLDPAAVAARRTIRNTPSRDTLARAMKAATEQYQRAWLQARATTSAELPALRRARYDGRWEPPLAERLTGFTAQLEGTDLIDPHAHATLVAAVIDTPDAPTLRRCHPGDSTHPWHRWDRECGTWDPTDDEEGEPATAPSCEERRRDTTPHVLRLCFDQQPSDLTAERFAYASTTLQEADDLLRPLLRPQAEIFAVPPANP